MFTVYFTVAALALLATRAACKIVERDDVWGTLEIVSRDEHHARKDA